MTKETYINAKNKHLIRDFLLKRFEFEQVVGLAGPDINEYIKFLKKRGCNKFELYENNPIIAVSQIAGIKNNSNVSITFGDILNAPADKEKTFYDLDFCATVPTLKEHIKKFENNFIMTFSVRKIGIRETVRQFFKYRDEKIEQIRTIMTPIKHIHYTTDKSQYLFISYKDTSPMCCIAKI